MNINEVACTMIYGVNRGIGNKVSRRALLLEYLHNCNGFAW